MGLKTREKKSVLNPRLLNFIHMGQAILVRMEDRLELSDQAHFFSVCSLLIYTNRPIKLKFVQIGRKKNFVLQGPLQIFD